MMAAGRPPNVLILMSDEHSPHATGYEGNAVVRTPALDRLAARGVWFRNAYCQSPLCVPSRMAHLASRHLHRINVWSNGDALDSAVPTIPAYFREHGYFCVSTGKMHFVGPDQMHGFELRPYGDHTHPIRDSGRGPDPYDPKRVRGAGPRDECAHCRRDERVTEIGLDLLRGWHAGQYGSGRERRPLLLWISWLRPHFPFWPPVRHWQMYDPATVDLPPRDDLADKPVRLARWRRHWGLENLTEEELRRARAAYYALVSFVDEQVAAVLDTLQQLGLEEDTLVIYCTDHGEMAGEHGMWYKSVFFEAAARTPLIFSWPGRLPQGRMVSQTVELNDMFPTIAAACGLPLPQDVDGANLWPLLIGERDDWRDEALSEFATQGSPSPAVMLRTGRWKYVHYGWPDAPAPEDEELYDLAADPHELRNLARDPATGDFRRELRARIRQRWHLPEPWRQALAERLARARGTGFSYEGPNRAG